MKNYDIQALRRAYRNEELFKDHAERFMKREDVQAAIVKVEALWKGLEDAIRADERKQSRAIVKNLYGYSGDVHNAPDPSKEAGAGLYLNRYDVMDALGALSED